MGNDIAIFEWDTFQILENLMSCLRSYMQVKSDFKDRCSDNSYHLPPNGVLQENSRSCYYKDPMNLIVSWLKSVKLLSHSALFCRQDFIIWQSQCSGHVGNA